MLLTKAKVLVPSLSWYEPGWQPNTVQLLAHPPLTLGSGGKELEGQR